MLDELLVFLSVSIVIGAVILLVKSLFFPRAILFEDQDGKLIFELSIRCVQQTDLSELERLHERVRRDPGVRARAVA